MDNFPSRPQDPYEMTDEQRAYVRENIFPYWKGKSVEDAFLARTSAETKKIGVDTGFVDTDSKWRNGIGEMSPDYVDQLFPKGFGGIKKEAEGYMAELNEAIPEEKDKHRSGLRWYRASGKQICRKGKRNGGRGKGRSEKGGASGNCGNL